MLFLVDAQLPVSLAAALRQAGCEALHVAEIGLTTATDRRVWEEAEVRSAVLITKDRDFAVLRAANRNGPTILWVRTGNISNRALIAQLLHSFPLVQAAIERHEPIIEFLGR